ncbi:MAG: hypothetical protein R3351_01645 [Nitrospirales bacterium]|nr:hypothetical protein [Nitrospirales bacterium]
MATGSPSGGQSQENKPVPETEILNVVVQREGRKVSTKWGLHPNLKEELHPEEWKELTDIMGKVTTIIGNRFTQVLDQIDQETSGSA